MQIETQQTNSDRAHLREWNNHTLFQTKVVAPAVQPGMKQRDDLACTGSVAGDIGTFPGVAPDTGQCKVFRRRIAAVLPAGDVIYLMRCKRIVVMEQAIFAVLKRRWSMLEQ